MKIAIGSDHAGFEMKEYLKELLSFREIEVVDKGAYSTESMDYPDTGYAVADAVAHNETDLGILFCGSGLGMSMVANKVKGIRAALCHCPEYAKLSKEHNNANILVMGARFLTKDQIKEIVDTWLDTPFSGDPRHQKRINKIEK